MNSNGFSRIIVSFGVMILALYISLDVFAGGSNAFGKFYLYSMIGGFMVGLLAPKKGFYFMLFLTGYLDYFKRLMIIDHGISQLDLYYVLGIAPATMAGIAIAVVYQLATGTVPRRPREGLIMVVTIFIVLLVGGLGVMSGGGGNRGLGDVVNSVAYLCLIFVIPSLFRTPEALREIFKHSILIFIPSVFYYIYSSFAGFTWWEYKYLLSGLTIEYRQLGERVVRVMGTLNGAGAATTIYSLDAAVLLAAGFWKYKEEDGPVRDSKLIQRWLLALLFCFAAYRTFSRAGWIQGVAAICGFWAFRRRFFTTALYVVFFALFGTLIAFSGYLLKNQMLNRWSDALLSNGSEEALQAGSMGSFNSRLEGFYNMTHMSSLWTPFGIGFQGKTMANFSGLAFHDAFSLMILKIGYVPLILISILVFFVLRAMHRFVVAQPPGLSASLGVTALSCFLANLLAMIANGAVLSNYPVNFYVYFDIGIVVGLMLYQWQKDQTAEAVAPARESTLRNRSNPYLRPPPPAPLARTPRPAFQTNRRM